MLTPDLPAAYFWGAMAILGFALQIRYGIVTHKRNKQRRLAHPNITRREQFARNLPYMYPWFLLGLLQTYSVLLFLKAVLQCDNSASYLQQVCSGTQGEINQGIILSSLLLGGLSLIGMILSVGNPEKGNAF